MDNVIFNFAQSFFIDSQAIKNAKEVDLSSIDLYFKRKPAFAGNKSNIEGPGVTIFLCEVDGSKNPNVLSYINGRPLGISTVEYTDIQNSADASRTTKFKFDKPVKVKTNKEYAFVGIFDGNEIFELWTSKQGDLLVGTNTVSPGPSGKYVGNYYNSITLSRQSLSTVKDATKPDVVTPSWRPSTDTDLKFEVNVARYYVNGVPIGNNSIASSLPVNVEIIQTSTSQAIANIVYTAGKVTYSVGAGSPEFIAYDRKTSNIQRISGGERVYQNTVFYPGGSANGITVSVAKGNTVITANSNYPNGSAFSWNDVYTSGSSDEEYIVIVSTHPSQGRNTNIRKVVSIVSNTQLLLDVATDFTNTAAYFIKSPVAEISTVEQMQYFNYGATTIPKRRERVTQDILMLNNSNANATNRFVNGTINSVSVVTGGTGYSNTDYVTISGFENTSSVTGGYVGRANLVVNVSTGAIMAVHLSNVGAGFSNSANLTFTISNNSGGSTAGINGNLSFTVGTVLRGEYDGRTSTATEFGTGGVFNDIRVVNLEFYNFSFFCNTTTFAGSSTNFRFYTPYYVLFDNATYLGSSYRSLASGNVKKIPINRSELKYIDYGNIPVLVSGSNEFVIKNDGTGAVNATPTPGSGIIEIDTVSNNDFVSISVSDLVMTYDKFNVNGDYSNENTDYGNAASKHITKKINFDNERFAEDLVVYLTAYRPLNTDIKVFARVHNSKDPEAFDDKDWTMLELRSGNIYSSSAAADNYIEMEFGFQNSPNVAFDLAGTVNVATTSTVTVIGTGTTFSTNATANLQVDDLVKIYSPLFPNSYAISVVTAVDSDTQFTISSPTGNADITGSGLKVGFIGRVGNSSINALGYPLQAFNNRNNDNVARYYSSSMMEYDTYDTLQLKLVFLADISQVDSPSSNVLPTTIPRVDDIRAVGVTS
jgi:hypothetical protein